MRTTPVDAWLRLPQPFLSREAHAAGLSSTAIAGGVRRGELVVLSRHLYAARSCWSRLSATEAHTALARAAQLSVAGSVVSHTSAALLHGLPRPWGPTGAVCLTARDSTRTAAHDDWRRVLDGALPGDHVTVVEGVPVTTVDRTVVDCLRTLRLRDGLAIADAALGAGATVVRALERVRRQQRGWPGVRTADLGISLADGRRESWLESASVGTAVALGWPVPLSQVGIHRLDGAFVGRVDLLWADLGVVGEADGRSKYLGQFDEAWDAERAAALMVRERDRERELESVGLAVARWGSSALRAGGGGLEVALRAASHRARADRVRCLWRDEAQGVLREWRELPPAPRIPRHLLPVNRHPGRQRPVW
ncbi:hypothetical protein [Phycicoccus sp. Soil748]|uniref:hypothetical protein n=1 Tax=Phycicoccus sp. Soil748 TaxID=1736397 RepID=UPI000703AAA2|nr:hypothetical protein [Phycicoccus sp. Soil748]KRE54717.1 hypothetical protein ASG70_11275 [Phycicoccus sp. Soil748]